MLCGERRGEPRDIACIEESKFRSLYSVHYFVPIHSVHESSLLQVGQVLEGVMQAAIYAPGLWNAAVLIAPGF
jgi:hypothetical protein